MAALGDLRTGRPSRPCWRRTGTRRCGGGPLGPRAKARPAGAGRLSGGARGKDATLREGCRRAIAALGTRPSRHRGEGGSPAAAGRRPAASGLPGPCPRTSGSALRRGLEGAGAGGLPGMRPHAARRCGPGPGAVPRPGGPGLRQVPQGRRRGRRGRPGPGRHRAQLDRGRLAESILYPSRAIREATRRRGGDGRRPGALRAGAVGVGRVAGHAGCRGPGPRIRRRTSRSGSRDGLADAEGMQVACRRRTSPT